jgi:cobalt-zinc-cadmium efflux system outer membrane protein
MALLSFAFAGCASRGGPFDDWIRAEDERLWQPASSSAWRSASADATNGAEAPLELPADADVEAHVRVALARNPSIRAAEQNVAAMAQRIPQVTSLDDPMLEVAPIGDMAETAAGSVSVMTGVSQRFPLGGKLSAAGRVAEAEVAVALAQLEERRLEVAGDVRRAFWRLYLAARALEVYEDNRATLDQFARSAEAMYQAGRSSQQDVLRVSIELSELDADILEFEQQIDSARAMLNQLMDRPIDAALPAPTPAALGELELELAALLREAVDANPSLKQIAAGIDADRERTKLARLERIPDLNVSFSYNLVDDSGLSPVANGDDQWWVGFGINVPIWQPRLEGAEREARLNVLRGLSRMAQQRNSIAFQIQDALLAARTAHRRAVLFRETIVPQAKQTLDSSLSAYQAGNIDALTVTDNRRRLLEFELMLHESIAALNRALADLKQLTGGGQVEQIIEPTGDGVEP